MSQSTDTKPERKIPAPEQQTSTQAVADDLLPDAIPDGFECPILKDIMQDPVMAYDGHSYERAAIEAWFQQARKKISPMTGAPLPVTLLTPNHNLRKAINHFLKQQPLLAQLKAQESRLKSQEQVLSDLQLAIQLHEQQLAAHLTEKASVVVSASSVSEEKETRPLPTDTLAALNLSSSFSASTTDPVSSTLSPPPSSSASTIASSLSTQGLLPAPSLTTQVKALYDALAAEITRHPQRRWETQAAASCTASVLAALRKQQGEALAQTPERYGLPACLLPALRQHLAQHATLASAVTTHASASKQLEVQLMRQGGPVLDTTTTDTPSSKPPL